MIGIFLSMLFLKPQHQARDNILFFVKLDTVENDMYHATLICKTNRQADVKRERTIIYDPIQRNSITLRKNYEEETASNVPHHFSR